MGGRRGRGVIIKVGAGGAKKTDETPPFVHEDKMSRHLKREDRIGNDLVMILVVIVLTGGAVAISLGIWKLYQSVGFLLLGEFVAAPAALVLLWFAGHIVYGLRSEAKLTCLACPYVHGNFITELWHSRRCLPLQLMKVGGRG